MTKVDWEIGDVVVRRDQSKIECRPGGLKGIITKYIHSYCPSDTQPEGYIGYVITYVTGDIHTVDKDDMEYFFGIKPDGLV